MITVTWRTWINLLEAKKLHPDPCCFEEYKEQFSEIKRRLFRELECEAYVR